ncbi:MAG: hypothetical protein IPJ86_08645 [Bacteroidetes bacterium]|nr:hypothetical protein [Bacteroidota bacterium]MBK9317831.1 hypothetical protein [Bacteroidota bacterium]
MNRNIKTGFALMGVVALSLSACKKEKESIDSDTASVAEYAMSDAAFNDVASISDEAYDGSLDSYRIQNGGSSEKVMTTCATITFDTTVTPKTLTIDFGPSDCLCGDGNYRRGAIIVSWTGPYKDSGSVRTITFNNYFVNYNQILGTKTVTNNGRNTSGNLSYTVTVNGSVVWDPQYFGGGGTSTFTSTRTRVWIAGEGTLGWLDDVYLISGSTNGTTRAGSTYTMVTTEALKKEIGFKHFTDGVLEFTPSGKYTRVIDYGYVNGQRDALAQVTINGYTFTIQLK